MPDDPTDTLDEIHSLVNTIADRAPDLDPHPARTPGGDDSQSRVNVSAAALVALLGEHATFERIVDEAAHARDWVASGGDERVKLNEIIRLVPHTR